MTKTGNPHVTDSMTLYGEQLELLLKFVDAYAGIPSLGNGKLEIPLDIALKKSKENSKLQQNEQDVIDYLKNNPSLIKTIVENEIDEDDLISLSYRKKQLNKFKQLLNDNDYFSKKKRELGDNKKDEDVWQAYFEDNTWIFGYGLNSFFKYAS